MWGVTERSALVTLVGFQWRTIRNGRLRGRSGLRSLNWRDSMDRPAQRCSDMFRGGVIYVGLVCALLVCFEACSMCRPVTRGPLRPKVAKFGPILP